MRGTFRRLQEFFEQFHGHGLSTGIDRQAGNELPQRSGAFLT